jgi:hypothetical protein
MASNSLPQLTDSTCGTGPGSVPVYNCVVILSPISGSSRLRGRIANLADIFAEGNSERDVLIQLSRQFKAVVQEHTRNSHPVPWIDPPESAGPGEQQRFIPVHL